MTMSKTLLAGVAVLALAMSGAAQAAQKPTTTPTKAGQSFDYSLITVTPQQKTLLTKAASRLPEQSLPRGLPGNPVIAGDLLPSSVKLTAIPNSVKQKIRQETAGNKLAQARMGDLLSDDLARARNGDVLVVDPVDRMVESVVRGS
jgi:glucose/arabinose dehydrogenase